MAFALLGAGCSGGSLSNSFGCDVAGQQGMHTCADYEYPDAATRSRGQMACTQAGGKLVSSCSTAGAVGGCRVSMNMVTVTTWYLAGITATDVLQLCNADNGTFEEPKQRASDGGTSPDASVPFTCDGLPSTKKVDLLVMVDNSNGVGAKSAQLVNEFGELLQPLMAAGVDLHLAVVTSDYGAGATGAPGCQPSPGGQLGKMQALGVNAPNTCKAPVGANYLEYDFAGGANNLPQGQDPLGTFTCMASVGSSGCGYEHPLESVYAALQNNLPENAGFVRADAVLAVLFLTDEDDESAPTTTMLFDKNQTAMYGYEDSYRATRFGVECGQPLMLPPYGDSMGPLSGCVPATDPPGEAFDVSRYVDLFALIKTDPRRVLLAAIDGPESPFQVILSNPGTASGTPYAPCGQLNETTNPPCVPVLQHSCQNPQEPVFDGDPAVRLNYVINSAVTHVIGSVCDGSYVATLQQIAQAIVAILC
jgi:hypothetical protein